MKLFFIIVALMASAWAAPTLDLQYLTPVNPDVLVEPKPEEKVILITDTNEIVKFKRETKEPFYPTVLPKESEPGSNQENLAKSRTKNQVATSVNKKLIQKSQGLNKSNLNYRYRRDLESYFPQSHQKRVIPVPSVDKHLYPEHFKKESMEKDSSEDIKSHNPESHHIQHHHATTDGFQKLSTLPLIFKETEQHKRDIPVPLVPKRHHPEESPKDINKEEPLENNKKLYSENDQTKTKDLSQQQQKRESPEKNNEVKSESYHAQYVHTMDELSKSQSGLVTDNKENLSIAQDSNHPEKLSNTQTKKITLKRSTEHGESDPEKSLKGSSSVEAELKEIPKKQSYQYKEDVALESTLSQKPLREDLNLTKENPIVRRRPVPIKELFSRPHGN